MQSVLLFAHLSAAWQSFYTKSKYRLTRSAVTTVCGLASIEEFNSVGTTGHFSCLKQLKIYEVYPCSAFFATKPYIDINEARHLQKICTFSKQFCIGSGSIDALQSRNAETKEKHSAATYLIQHF